MGVTWNKLYLHLCTNILYLQMQSLFLIYLLKMALFIL